MEDILKEGSKKLGIDLSDYQIEQMCIYSELLVEWNKKMNLTAITDKNEIAVKHFLDSLTALTTGNIGEKVIDVGTGAGFPGLVIKIAVPDIKLTLLDSMNKRLNFLKAVVKELDIKGVKFVHTRAEDGGRNVALREKFDTAVSRAVANLTILSEYCLPYVMQGGYFIALKGPQAEDEAEKAKRAVSILGGGTPEIIDADVPFTEFSHKIVRIKKERRTPLSFPRKPQMMTKTPIESCYNMYKRPGK